jgi:glycosyltransferase involved in cell wall biosynthesis
MANEKRVLWFSTLPLPSANSQSLMRYGWQEGLRKALEIHHPEVELGIVVFSSTPHEPVKVGNATFFTFPRVIPSGRIGKMWKAWQHLSYTTQELNLCMDLVNGFSPDLVHFHGSENFFSLIGSRLKVPSVLSIQAIVNGYRPYLFSDMSWKDILWKLATKESIKGEGIIHKWHSWNKYYLDEQKILRSCKHFIGRTEWDRAVLLAYNPLAHYYHCDEPLADIFYDLEWHPEQDQKSIIYSTSSNAFSKGGLILAKAISILNKRGFVNVQLRLAGLDAESDLGRTIRKFVIQDQIEEKVDFLGRLYPQQIIEEMQKASVFVLPSHIDNSPNSLCEAMLMGMPCIAAHVGGIPSLVRDGVDGLLYHDRDPYILAEKIIKLLEDRDLATRLGLQARKTALQRHDRKKIADRTMEIYRSILSG